MKTLEEAAIAVAHASIETLKAQAAYASVPTNERMSNDPQVFRLRDAAINAYIREIDMKKELNDLINREAARAIAAFRATRDNNGG